MTAEAFSQLSAPRPEGRNRLTRSETPSERASSCMAGISPAFWAVSTVLMLVGMEVAASSFTAAMAASNTPSPRMASQVSLRRPVQAHLDGHQPVGGKPCHPLGTDQRAVGGDAGHDAMGMAGRQDLFEVGADERLAAAEVDLEDTRGMQLLHQVEGFGCREFVAGRVPRRRETVTAPEVTGQRDLPGQIYRGTHPHFDIFIAHGEIPFPGVV